MRLWDQRWCKKEDKMEMWVNLPSWCMRIRQRWVKLLRQVFCRFFTFLPSSLPTPRSVSTEDAWQWSAVGELVVAIASFLNWVTSSTQILACNTGTDSHGACRLMSCEREGEREICGYIYQDTLLSCCWWLPWLDNLLCLLLSGRGTLS